MTCYNPIKAFVIGTNLDGKKVHKFANKEQRNQDWLYFNGKYYYEYDLLPCGHCLGCTMKRSRDWATRMMLELESHDRACFITLTYNDDNLPLSHYVDSNGEEQLSFTLVKSDFQKFMKRLRKHYSDMNIRFFACGEYGSKTKRPHYHAIVYGIDFSEDRQIWQTTKDGFIEYRSPTLEKLWKFGYSMIAEVNWNTCAYVSRYCTKKKYGVQNIYYQTFNILPEFNLMSRRPGIASEWFKEHGDEVYINQEIFLTNLKGGMTVRPPAYFDKLYDLENPEEMKEIKEARKAIAEEEMKKKLSKTDMNLYEMLEAERRMKEQRLKSLRRDKI